MRSRIAEAAALVLGLGLSGLAFLCSYLVFALVAYVVEMFAGLDHAPLDMIPTALALGNGAALLGAVAVTVLTIRVLMRVWRGLLRTRRSTYDAPAAPSTPRSNGFDA